MSKRNTFTESRKESMAVCVIAPADGPILCLFLPCGWRFIIFPPLIMRVMFKVAILVAIPIFQQLEESVAQGWVHPNCLSRVVAPNPMARKAVFKQCLLEGAATIENACRSIPGWIDTPFTAGVVPGTKCVPSSVERTEVLLAGLCAHCPRGHESSGVAWR